MTLSSSLASYRGNGCFEMIKMIYFMIFPDFVEDNSYMQARLFGVIRAIKIVSQFGWLNLWLETYSTMVILVTQDSDIVPWNISNMIKVRFVIFFITHNYREKNQYTNKLALMTSFTSPHIVWNSFPSFTSSSLYYDKLNMSNYKFDGVWVSFSCVSP